MLTVDDLSAGGFGQSWGHTRNYNNQMTSDVDLGNGVNWLVYQWPYLIEDGSDVIIVRPGQDSEWFVDSGGGMYAAQFGNLDALTYDMSSDQFTWSNPAGTAEIYAGFSSAEPGRLLHRLTPGGESVNLTYSGGLVSEMVRSYTAAGVTLTESYLYDYIASGPNAGHVASVTLRRQAGSNGFWYNVRQAMYTYYDGIEVGGALNDLKTATRLVPAEGIGWEPESTDYYRYYEDSSTGLGFAHGLKYVLGPEAYARLVAAVGNPFTASDEQVAQFADSYFEYNGLRQVSREDVGGGTRTYKYTYATSGFAPDPNNWSYQTTEQRPDGSQRNVYMNSVGQPMLDELVQGTSRWITYQQFSTDNQVIFIAAPSAINLGAGTVYNPMMPDLAVQLLPSAGLVTKNTFYTTGGPPGFPKQSAIQQGTGGTANIQLQLQYSSNTVGLITVQQISQKTVYSDDANTHPIVTSYAYTYHPTTNQRLQKTTTLPVISTGQNGSGTPATQQEQYDLYGNMTWEQGPRGFIDNFTYDIVTGALVQMIEDVDPSILPIPSGWSRPSGLPAPLHLITDYEFDDLGRTTQSLGPEHDIDGVGVRRAKWTVYRDADHQTWSGNGYATGLAPSYVFTLVNPVSITQRDLANRTIDAIQAARPSVDGPLDADDQFDQSTWTRWTHRIYNVANQLVASRAYSTIPVSGDGQPGVNYDETDYGYDIMGRQNRVVAPGGTISRTVFDAEGRQLASWVGTDDYGATDADPSGGSAPGNNMVQVTTQTYSTGCDCTQPNQITQFVDSTPANNRVTGYTLDYRNRVTVIDGEIDFYQINTYDNLNHLIEVDRKDTTSGGNLIAQTNTSYDDQGRVYQTITYGVDPSTGIRGNSVVSYNWYDEAGNLIKSLPAGSRQFTKTMYDSQARPYAIYQGYYTGTEPEPYPDYGQITSSNVIFEQVLTTYDQADNAIEVDTYQRFHNATGNGALNSASSGTQPLARVSYQASWFDGIGGQTATANYGTFGNAPFTRPDMAPPSSGSVLVTAYGYDDAGNQFQTIDPTGIETRRIFNALGSVTSKISNYTGAGPGNDHDVTIQMAYNADGNPVSLTAVNPTTGDQVTTYLYGVTLANSSVARNDLLRATIYPDAVDGADRVVQSYNRQGQLTQLTDQRYTVHQYVYDLLGRQTDDIVSAVGEADGSVRRISQSFEVRGLVENITSYSNTGGTTVVNQVQNQYNSFQQLVIQYQQHGAAVNPSTSPSVDYSYADGSAHIIRPTSIVYPNNRTIAYTYASGNDDALNRITSLNDVSGGTTLASYTYLGLATFVATNYSQPSITWDLTGSSSLDPYPGLDPFGRVIDCKWRASSGNAEDIKYGYNQASSRIWRQNTVASSGGNDELYAYDNLQRLTDMSRGTLASGNQSINSMSFAQQWQLDATGNWSGFITADTQTAANNLDQQRTSNQANEVTAFSQRYGTAWTQPVYDRAGNMFIFPQPLSPASQASGSYDAWNRLVAYSNPTTTRYTYDGLNRRATKTTGSTVRHFYYSDQWQVLEERTGTSTTPDRQFVWGQRYIDDLVLRDRSVSGTLDERFYSLQDANWNVTAIVGNPGSGWAVQERYRYSAYGTSTVLDASFNPRSGNNSLYDWETRYTGYRWDIESGLYQVRNRYLNSTLGSWISRDPVEDLKAVNLDLYVENNPLSNRDPSGLLCQSMRCEERICERIVYGPRFELEDGGGTCPYDWVIEVPPNFSPLNEGEYNCVTCATQCEGAVPAECGCELRPNEPILGVACLCFGGIL